MTLPDPLADSRRTDALRQAETIRKAIKYLKTTPAVTLVGKGGAYELLEAYAQRLEESDD